MGSSNLTFTYESSMTCRNPGVFLSESRWRYAGRVGVEQRNVNWTREPMSTTKSYDEIIDFIAAGTTPESVVTFQPSDSVQQRVADLVERSKTGSISVEDQSELEDYLQLEHLMIMAKARARRHTQLGQ